MFVQNDKKVPSGNNTIHSLFLGMYAFSICDLNWTKANSRCRGPYIIMGIFMNLVFISSKCQNHVLLTEPMKKSWWIKLTIPKFVYIKTLSIIHIMFGITSCFVLNVDINIGTSAVDWWLTRTNVRWSSAGEISSPTSTTVRLEIGERDMIYYICSRAVIFVSFIMQILCIITQ